MDPSTQSLSLIFSSISPHSSVPFQRLCLPSLKLRPQIFVDADFSARLLFGLTHPGIRLKESFVFSKETILLSYKIQGFILRIFALCLFSGPVWGAVVDVSCLNEISSRIVSAIISTLINYFFSHK
jgi:hypothetical protein